jgi:glycosyltransferase involved in cell wall biosynthesis
VSRQGGLGPVLFVVPFTTRTGTPIMLLHFLRWLRRNTDIEVTVLVVLDGPLRSEFEAVAPTSVLWRERGVSSWHWRLQSKLDSEGLHKVAAGLRYVAVRTRVRQQRRIQTVYLNGVASWAFAPLFRRGQTVVIGHAHELAHELQAPLQANECWLTYALQLDGVIAASDAVVDDLVAGGLPIGRIRRHYEFIDTRAPMPSSSAVASVRSRLGIAAGVPIVGGAGFPTWRKGPDLFVQLARAMLARRPGGQVAFVWVGGGPDVPEFWKVTHDTRAAGLNGNVHFVETQSEPAVWFAAFDVFALTSREDPFPLVCLEAAWLGKPVVCFDRAGGAPELVANGCGAVVPYLDIEAMADRVWGFLDDPSSSASVGTRASAWVREHHDVDVAAPALLEDIERISADARRP